MHQPTPLIRGESGSCKVQGTQNARWVVVMVMHQCGVDVLTVTEMHA
jgi:hypothetical protein